MPKKRKPRKIEPNEDSEMWHEYKEELKEINEQKRIWSKELLDEFIAKHEIELKVLQPWQIRLTKKSVNVCYDIYPTRNRWHNITTRERGGYNDLIGFLEKVFLVDPK